MVGFIKEVYMPLYEWKCPCGWTHQDIVRNYNPKKRIPCAECKGIAEIQIGVSSFHLKGDGWYKKPPKEPKDE
jgi:predicted nucleic acid-binding Zn ribbon protein